MEPAQIAPDAGEIAVDVGSARLFAALQLPLNARGVVVVAHASASARHTLRNRLAAQVLRRTGMGTLSLDLLTPAEEAEDARTGHLRHDVPRLAERLTCTLDWLSRQPHTAGHAIGIYASGTAGAAALITAAHRPGNVRALVLRSTRLDVTSTPFAAVRAPTLLIASAFDDRMLVLHEAAFERLSCTRELLVIVDPADISGPDVVSAEDEVAEIASDWLRRFALGHGALHA